MLCSLLTFLPSISLPSTSWLRGHTDLHTSSVSHSGTEETIPSICHVTQQCLFNPAISELLQKTKSPPTCFRPESLRLTENSSEAWEEGALLLPSLGAGSSSRLEIQITPASFCGGVSEKTVNGCWGYRQRRGDSPRFCSSLPFCVQFKKPAGQSGPRELTPKHSCCGKCN